MRKPILIYSILIILVSVAITATVSAYSINRDYIDGEQEALATLCRAFSAEVLREEQTGTSLPLTDYADKFAGETGYRVTFIDASGKVLADSEAGDDYTNMKNHGNRKEVKDAILSGSGVSIRESGTFDGKYIYVALAANEGDGNLLITRLSMKIETMKIAMDHALKTVLPSATIGILLALVVALLYSRRLTRPIRSMEEQLTVLLAENRKAEDIRREFVANVTHELKTPLTSISGFVETLQRSADEDPEVRKKFLSIISVESARLARLIDDILIISDIENGREAAGHSDVNVKKAIEETIEALSPLAASLDIALEFSCDYEMHIGGDYDRFKQMMMNLIENAVKYSGNGKRVCIDAEKIIGATAADGEDKVVICVRDEGIGIAEEHIPRLFERFYRVDKSRSKNVGGTGLGLAIVKHIAALYDAELSVESEVGKGSVFTVTFKS